MKNIVFFSFLMSTLSLAQSPRSLKFDFVENTGSVEEINGGFLVYGTLKGEPSIFSLTRYDANLNEVRSYRKDITEYKKRRFEMTYATVPGSYAFKGNVTHWNKYEVLTLDSLFHQLFYEYIDHKGFTVLERDMPRSERKGINGGNLTFTVGTNNYSCFEHLVRSKRGSSYNYSKDNYFICADEYSKEIYKTKLFSSPEDVFSPSYAKYNDKEKTILIVGNYTTLSKEDAEENKEGWNDKAASKIEFQGVRFILLDFKTGEVKKVSELKFSEFDIVGNDNREKMGNNLCAIRNVEVAEDGSYIMAAEFYGALSFHSQSSGPGAPVRELGNVVHNGVSGFYNAPFKGFSSIVLDAKLNPTEKKMYNLNSKSSDIPNGMNSDLYFFFNFFSPGGFEITPFYLDMKQLNGELNNFHTPYTSSYLKTSRCIITAMAGVNGPGYYSFNLETGKLSMMYEIKNSKQSRKENPKTIGTFISGCGTWVTFTYDKIGHFYELNQSN